MATKKKTMSNAKLPTLPNSESLADLRAQSKLTPREQAYARVRVGRNGMMLSASKPKARAKKPAPKAEAIARGNESLVTAYSAIVSALDDFGYDTTNKNYEKTGERAAKAMSELVWPRSRIESEIDAIIAVSFPRDRKTASTVGDMVVIHNHVVFNVCPHHLLPVIGIVDVAYIPKKTLLGLSKIPRLAEVISHQPIMQEDYVQELADVLFKRIDSSGSAVVCRAMHLCMACRGVKAHESHVTVSAVRGAFENASTRAEFMSMRTTQRFLAG